jgi:NAD(P)-dependent dehydrogenase (short-subunit alcohol dehydrogenase family)
MMNVRPTRSLRGKVVLVTGASSGIGRAAALEFDRLGARVAMAARRAERLEENAATMTDALVVPTDVSDMDAVNDMVDSTVAHYGRLDVLVNNAGVTRIERSDAMDMHAVVHLFNTHFVGAMVATRRAVPTMRLHGGGHIVNVTSPAALLGVAYNGSYSASKGALTGWTRTLQAEWAGTEILVTEYNPGLVKSEMGQAAHIDAPIEEVPNQPTGGRQSLIRRLISRPLTSEQVGAHLVHCVQRQKLVAYSTRSQTLAMHLCELPAVRRAVGAEIATSMRANLKLGTWTETTPPTKPAPGAHRTSDEQTSKQNS